MKTTILSLLLILAVSFSGFATTTESTHTDKSTSKIINPSPDNSVRRIKINFTYKDQSLKEFACHLMIPNGEEDYWEQTSSGMLDCLTLYNSPEELHLKYLYVPYYIDIKYQATATSASGNPVNPTIYISGNQISIRLQQLIDVSDTYIVNVTLSL